MDDVLVATARLVLRRWRKDDAAVLLRMRSDPEVARWMADTTPWSELKRAQDTIATWNSELDADPGLGTWAIVAVDADGPVGSASLRPLPGEDGGDEIGWALDPSAWGRGYAREAAAALLDHGRSLHLRRVWAVMWPGNTPSAKVCRAIGMRDLGVRPAPWYGGDSHTFLLDLGPLTEPRSVQAPTPQRRRIGTVG